jgi:VIT1/CCC1 family predicted Fe2+/Mn2+ transporter
MINRFEARGMERKDAELVVGKMAQYENFFVGLMVAEELGVQLPEDDDAMLLTDAFIMCISFGFFGIIPLGTFCLGPLGLESQHTVYVLSISISLFLLCILATIKSSFSSATSLHAAIEALCLGIVCSALSYAVGMGVKSMLAG